ncbi:CBS domain-containing protein [Roseomonas sp. F4]
MRARDLMTPNPVTFQPGTPITVAARAMAERGFSGAPVVDADGRLLGMLTEGDLLPAWPRRPMRQGPGLPACSNPPAPRRTASPAPMARSPAMR